MFTIDAYGVFQDRKVVKLASKQVSPDEASGDYLKLIRSHHRRDIFRTQICQIEHDRIAIYSHQGLLDIKCDAPLKFSMPEFWIYTFSCGSGSRLFGAMRARSRILMSQQTGMNVHESYLAQLT